MSKTPEKYLRTNFSFNLRVQNFTTAALEIEKYYFPPMEIVFLFLFF